MNFEALANAIVYALAGLGIFAIAARVIRGGTPATDLPEAIIRAALILGAALIIAHTMH